MTDLDTCLRAILLDPADDLARLAYADACEEQGDSDRADFIRLQVEYAKLYPHWNEHRARLCRRCQRAEELDGLILSQRFLVPRDGPAPWAQDCPWRLCGLPADYTGPRIEWDWHRGFVCEIRLTLADFMRHAQALFGAHPIERVGLTDREPVYVDREPGFAPWTWMVLADKSHPIHDTIPQAMWWLIPEKWYSTSDDARDALSCACVAWGRQQVGLPPYVKPPAKRIR